MGKGRKKVVLSEKQDKIVQLIEAMPTTSSHCLASQVQVPHTSTYCAIQETKFLYRIHVFQELKPPDACKRLHFRHWLYNFIHNRRNIHNYIFFSDDVWFHLSGFINPQNYRVWSSTNPCVYQKVSFHPLKVVVPCLISELEVKSFLNRRLLLK